MGMLTTAQIVAIIMLLQAFGVEQAVTSDVQRILEGRPNLTSSQTTTMAPAQPPVAPPSSGNGATAPALNSKNGTATAQIVSVAPASKARIEIVNYRAGSGLNRPHSTSPDFDELGNPKNELDIGTIVYGEDGEPTRSATVTVTMKSPTGEQAHPIQGTGTVTPIYVNGQKQVVPVYTFHYEFNTPGTHIVTFSANGMQSSATIEVSQ